MKSVVLKMRERSAKQGCCWYTYPKNWNRFLRNIVNKIELFDQIKISSIKTPKFVVRTKGAITLSSRDSDTITYHAFNIRGIRF